MEVEPGLLGCQFCAARFVRPHLRGRRPLYCSRTCRQRAYEVRRRGAHFAGLPKLVAPGGRLRGPRAVPGYEVGKNRKRHALRPVGIADRFGYRPTLCGLRARPVPGRSFSVNDARNCTTCRRVAARFPPKRFLEPADDLARLRAYLSQLRVQPAQPLEPLVRAILELADCA